MRPVVFACLLTACWTGSAAVPETRVAVHEKCSIHDTEVAGFAKLSADGLAFAYQSQVTRLDVTFHGAVARARVENESLVLDGDLDLEEMPIRPRELEPLDGWLEIHHATAKLATASTLRIEAALPEGLAPKTAQFSLPCSELTFAAPPETEATGDQTKLELAIGTQLRAKPDGPAVLRVIGPIDGIVVDRRAGMSHMRIDSGQNVVFGWVSSQALKPTTIEEDGGFGFGRSGIPHSFACSRDVPIWVHAGGRTIKVGRIKQGAPFHLAGDNTDEDDVGIELGLTKPDTLPFLRQSDFAFCG